MIIKMKKVVVALLLTNTSAVKVEQGVSLDIM
jgi:hypothetical protein